MTKIYRRENLEGGKDLESLDKILEKSVLCSDFTLESQRKNS